jgi:PIN domain nuclease of toxin-antitoxin system
VLDASALLALLKAEPGHERVTAALAAGAVMSAVNLSETAGKLQDDGVPEDDIHAAIDPLAIEIVAFDAHLAYRAALLRAVTRTLGLAFGDRACLALGADLGLPVVTTDRAWAQLPIGVTVQLVR